MGNAGEFGNGIAREARPPRLKAAWNVGGRIENAKTTGGFVGLYAIQ